MRSRLNRIWKRKLFVAGGAALSLLTSAAAGQAQQIQPCVPPPVLSPYNPCPPLLYPSMPGAMPSPTMPGAMPSPTMPGVPSTPTPPGVTPPATPPTDVMPTAPTTPNIQFGGGGEGAAGRATTSFLAPNVIGDLLFTSRSVNFGFVRVNGTTNFQGLASTSIVNSSVDENNSPIPQDRVYFRYNFFADAQSVTGLSPRSIPFTQPNPLAVFPPGSELAGQMLPIAQIQLPQTKLYDSNVYTFGIEKTFLDNRMSVELRVPFVSSLASHNNFSVGSPNGTTGGTDAPFGGSGNNADFNVLTTAGNTLGHEDTEWGNLTLIFKGLLYQNQDRGIYFSGGAGVTVPTGQDEHLSVIDYAAPASDPFATSQRRQNITIANETTSLAPFFAALWVPNDRFFTQSFASIEVPIGSSRITYNDQHFVIPAGGTALAPAGAGFNIVTAHPYIDEQVLAHTDWNAGYWVYRAPEKRWLSGIAPCVEVHYTSALDNAQRVQLPGDGSFMNAPIPISRLPVPSSQVTSIPAPGPVVGGGNRVNIVDMTVGTTFQFGQRTTLAAAFSAPLTNGSNRTFDWEFQLQLNYYFGHH